MEFLSEDLYGGFYSGLPEAQPWNSMQGFTSPYGVYGINQAGLLAQQNLPVNASGMLNIGVDLDTQAIQDQVNQNLTNLDDAPLPGEGPRGGIEIVAPDWLTPDPSDTVIITSGYSPNILEVFGELIGVQGVPEGTSPEVLAALEGRLDGADQSTIQQVAQEISESDSWEDWLSSQEQEEGTSISDIVEGATEAVTEGVSSAVQDAIDAARDALPDDASVESILDWIAENVPEITPQSIFDEYIGAGVGVNLPTGAPIGSGTVFIPGIPGLPSSSPNMVIGTVEEVLQDILDGNLPGVLGDIAEDPVGGIGAAIEGAADDAQEVTIGDLLGTDDGLGIGDDEVSDIFTEEGQTTDYGGGLNDGETEDILADTSEASSGGGGGGGLTSASKPHKGGVAVNLPQGQMLLYRPPTANEILTDFTNGLAMQRRRGMLV